MQVLTLWSDPMSSDLRFIHLLSIKFIWGIWNYIGVLGLVDFFVPMFLADLSTVTYTSISWLFEVCANCKWFRALARTSMLSCLSICIVVIEWNNSVKHMTNSQNATFINNLFLLHAHWDVMLEVFEVGHISIWLTSQKRGMFSSKLCYMYVKVCFELLWWIFVDSIGRKKLWEANLSLEQWFSYFLRLWYILPISVMAHFVLNAGLSCN